MSRRQRLRRSSLWALLPYVRPHARLLGTAAVLMPLASLVSVTQPYLIKQAIDAVLLPEKQVQLSRVIGLYGLAVAAEFVLRFAQTFLLQLGGQRAIANVRAAIFAKLQRVRIAYFDRQPGGAVVTRATSDVESLSEFFTSGAVSAVADLVTLFGIVGFMVALDIELTLVAFLALPPLALVLGWVRRRARDAFRAIRQRVAALNAHLAEQVEGLSTVVAYGQQARCQREYAERNDAYLSANLRAIRLDALLFSLVESISALGVAALLAYAVFRIEWLGAPAGVAAYVGTVVAFYEYIQRFFVPIRDLSQKFTVVQAALASTERIEALLDEPEESGRGATSVSEFSASTPTIAFRHVSFAYRPGEPVLRDISFEVAQGQKVGLVGATGAGKTTVISLLLRLYEDWEGEIALRGCSVRALSPAALRQHFAVVAQEAFFGGATLGEALTAGRPELRGRLDEVLRALDLTSRLRGRSLDAPLVEQAQNFSAGERQLLAFARAVVLDRPVVVFDEATSQLDLATEERVQRACAYALQGKTALIIAHRLATIDDADLILVFREGRIVERGTSAELLGRGGYFAELHRLQNAA